MALAAFKTGGTFSDRGAGKGAGATNPTSPAVVKGAVDVTAPLRGVVVVDPELLGPTFVTAWLPSDIGNSFRDTGSAAV